MTFLVLFDPPSSMAPRGRHIPSSSPDPLCLPDTPSSPDPLQNCSIPEAPSTSTARPRKPSGSRRIPSTLRAGTLQAQLVRSNATDSDWEFIDTPSDGQPVAPRTPPKTTSATFSTPNNKGAASQHDYESHNKRSEVDSFVLHDLEKRVYLPLDNALKQILGLDEALASDLEDLAYKVQKEQTFRDTMEAYLDVCDTIPLPKESAFYQPFLNLINTIAKLVYKLDRSFTYTKLFTYQQDHFPLAGADAKLIPDLLTVHQTVFDASGLAPDCPGPGTKTFAFGHALHFWDLKPKTEWLDFGVGGAMILDEDGEDYRPTSVVSHHQRTRDAQLSTDVATVAHPLKRSYDSVSGHNTTSGSSSKRIRTQPPSTVASKPPADDTINNDTKDRRATALQMARYALEILSKAGLRTHCIGFVVGLDSLELLYYDRSSIVVSGLLNFREDPAKFVTMMIAFLRRTQEQRGIPSIVEDRMSLDFAKGQESGADPNGVFAGVRLTMSYKGKDVVVTLGRILKRQTVLLGRGTCIVEATCKEIQNKELVLKISFPSTTRKSEADILQAIVAAASKDSKWVHTHLPKMFASRDVHISDDSPGGNLYRYFQDQGLQFADNGKTFSYEKRVMRLILLEKLTPLEQLREVRDYAQVFFDILQIHRWVYDVPQILHRDLSQGNIMVRRDSKGRYRGVLNDWDLSSYFKDIGQGATSHFRTGTRPFMAHELHLTGPDGPPMHRYRHDLESLFFIMVLLFCRNTLNPDASNESPLRPYHVEGFKSWDYRNDVDLHSAKKLFLIEKCKHFPLAGFDSFRHWIQGLHQIFLLGLSFKITRDAMGEDDDPELLLNNVTYDSFFAVMAPFKHTQKSVPLIVSYPPS